MSSPNELRTVHEGVRPSCRRMLLGMETLSERISLVSEAIRQQVAELGEVGATFLVIWLILAVAAFVGLTFALAL
jgi:hypothetical protein